MTSSSILDPERLASLDSYSVLDSAPEEGFDDIVRLAARLCETPVALVSLVAHDRQWFKAKVGFPQCETELDRSVCKFVLVEPDLLVIPDLTRDARTATNPLVTGELGIRFYAGAPLRMTDGAVLGSLCVIDTAPRPGGLTPEQADDLRALSRQVSSLLALRRTAASERRAQDAAETNAARLERISAAQEASEDRYRVLYENIDAGFCICEVKFGEDGRAVDHRVLAANPAFERHTGLSNVVGRWANEIAPGIEQHWHDAYGQVAKTGEPLRFEGEAAPLGRWYDAHLFPVGGGRVAMLIADTTARRQAEAALRSSEALARENSQRVQLALEAGAIIGTWNWDIPSDRFTVDEAFAHSFGLDPALGREGIPLAQIVATVHPDDKVGLADAITKAILRGGTYAHQYRVRRLDGRYYWIEASGRVDMADDGTPLSFPGVLLDIEARRAAEAALRTAEERLQMALTASGAVGLWDWMVDSDLLHGDAQFARLYGLDPDRTAAGLTMEQYQGFVVPEDLAPLRAAIRETFDHAAPFQIEYRLAIPDQALRWVECKGQLIPDEAGRAVRFSGTAVDISERKLAEVLLADSEAHWRGLFERLSEGFIVGEVVRGSDGAITDWRYIDVNRAWGELVGIDPSTVLGRTLREVLPDVEDVWVDEFAEVVRTGRGVTFTRQVGSLARWYEGRAFSLGAERFGVIFLDVTERLQASRQQDALLRLGEVLRDVRTRSEIASAAAEIAGFTLGLSRAGYGSVDVGREEITVEQDWALPGLDSIAGPHAFRTYGSYIELLKRGETVIIGDTARDPLTADTADALLQVQTRALINLPILEHGQFVALFFLLAAEPRDWSEGELSFIRTVADRTRSAVARIEAEERQDLLNRELSHRLKNTLAVVQSIASQTLKGVTERDVVENYERRIIALSRAHDVLLQGNYAAASLRTVIGTVLGLLAPKDQLIVEGEDVPLGPQAALSLSLLLHELATNASKYGAWSVSGGTVTVTWHTEPGPEATFVLDWRERGGPPAMEPTRRGFGSRLIRTGLLGTRQTVLNYLGSGFEAEFRAPDAQVRST
ncbi:PAS domain-containing protein [Methylobacterium oryzihabitans]|uniref:Blue-light-activated histidine kinase n=1 Tax=Methylobacterium oryzihabitans TaxID=2499852 RepID=A0A437P824_9HYPH|nr:PAS domain-containing protein [Methylobacterium oryzihabitans]RVU18450.1 GAF domain-containing protein [Methylobacterium oryzihabitans]